jgi:hypothetical protein
MRNFFEIAAQQLFQRRLETLSLQSVATAA